MYAIQRKTRLSTQPAITADQARMLIWVRGAFAEGMGEVLQKFLIDCTADQAAELLCTAQMARMPSGDWDRGSGLNLMFTEETIETARQKYGQGDRFHRLVDLYAQFDKGMMFDIEDDRSFDGHRTVFGDDTEDLAAFMVRLNEMAAPYRAAILEKVRANMMIKPLVSSIRLV